jgi:hypothetical protein
MVNTSRMVGAKLGVAILGTIFAAYAGQNTACGPDFLPGLHAAMTGTTVSELLGAVVAFALIRRDSLKSASRA